jgi:hypothetical protein
MNRIFLIALFLLILPNFVYCQNEIDLCSKIETRKDKFNGSEISIPPMSGGIAFMRVKRGNDIAYYINITNIGKTVSVDAKGAKILFSDGSKFEKNEKVDVRVNDKAEYEYNSLIKLSAEELDLFLNKDISDTRLYIYDNSLSKDQSYLVKTYFKCMINMN